VGSLTGSHDLSRLACRSSRAISQPQPKPWRVVAGTPCVVVRLAFATTPWILLIGSRLRHDSFTEAYRFARSNAGVRPEGRPSVGLLSWGSSIAPSPTRPSLRPLPPEPSSRLRSETATFRTCSVLAVPPGFNGFLRRGLIRRPNLSTACGFVAPRSRSWGSPRFQLLWSALRPSATLGSGPHGPGNLPLWRIPYEAFPSSAAIDHAVTASHPFGCGCVHRLACPPAVPVRSRFRVATLRFPDGRPQGLVPPRSPLRPHSVSAVHRSMLPWALDRTRSDAAAPCLPCAGPASAGPFALRFQPASAPPDPRVGGGGKESRLCLAPNNRCWCSPEGECPPVPVRWQPEDCYASGPVRPIPRRERSKSVAFGSGASRRRHLGRAPSRPRRVRRSASSQPEGSPPRRSVSPEGARSPANRIAFPKKGVATQRSAPEGRHRWFELPPSILLRSPAYLMVGSLAADCTPEGVVICAPPALTSRRTFASDPTARPPKESHRHGEPRGHREVVRSRFVAPAPLQQAGATGLGPDSHRLHRNRPDAAPKSDAPCRARRPAGRRRSVEGRGGSAHPTRVGGDPSRAPKCPCREGP
jgi:hypothetical protein